MNTRINIDNPMPLEGITSKNFTRHDFDALFRANRDFHNLLSRLWILSRKDQLTKKSQFEFFKEMLEGDKSLQKRIVFYMEKGILEAYKKVDENGSIDGLRIVEVKK